MLVLHINNSQLANCRPAALETTTGPQTNFDWLVQSYDFNIDDSNIFFFWLFEGDSSAQGNGSLPNSVSSYFVIAKAVTTSSTLPSSTISTSIISTSAATASTSPTSSTAAATTTSAVASSGSGGLSTGASAGIGIGVGLAVVAVAAIIAFILWRRRTNKKVQQEQSAILERRDQDDKGAWQPHTPYTPHSAQTMMQPNTPYTQHSAQTAAPMYQQESYMSTSPPSSTFPYNTSKTSPRYEASAEPTAVEIG